MDLSPEITFAVSTSSWSGEYKVTVSSRYSDKYLYMTIRKMTSDKNKVKPWHLFRSPTQWALGVVFYRITIEDLESYSLRDIAANVITQRMEKPTKRTKITEHMVN